MSPQTPFSAAGGAVPGAVEFAATGEAGARRRRWPMTALRLIVSLSLVGWILRGVSPREVMAAMQGVNIWLVGAALGSNFLGYGITVSRWRTLLGAQGVRAPFGYLVRSYITSIFFSNLLPSTIGGDAVRAYDSWRLGRNKADAVTVVLVDRLLGVVALVLFAFVAAVVLNAMHFELPFPSSVIFWAAAVMLGAVWLFLMSPRRAGEWARSVGRRAPGPVRRTLGRAAAALAVFRARKDALAIGLGLSLLLQANVVIHYFLLGLAMGFDVPFTHYFLIVALPLAATAAPISINGIGLRESAFTLLLGIYGVSRPDAIAFAWIGYLLMLLQGVMGGILYAFRREGVAPR